MIDPRNRPAFIACLWPGGHVRAALVARPSPPLLAWMAGWSVPAFAMYGIDKRQAGIGRLARARDRAPRAGAGRRGGRRLDRARGLPPQDAQGGVQRRPGHRQHPWAAIVIWSLLAVAGLRSERDSDHLPSPAPTAGALAIVVVSAALAIGGWLPGPSVPSGAAAQTSDPSGPIVSPATTDPVTIVDVNGEAISIEDASRVATLGGVFTETAYALGAADQVAAVDDSSYYPPEALADKPKLRLSPVPVCGARPGPGAQPHRRQRRDRPAGGRGAAAGCRCPVAASCLTRTTCKARATSSPRSARSSGARRQPPGSWRSWMRTWLPRRSSWQRPATRRGCSSCCSRRALPRSSPAGTRAAGSMITLAGGENIYPGFDSYIPMTAEGIAEAAPDVILTTDQSLAALGGREAFLASAGVAQTPAGQARPRRLHGTALPARLRPAHRPGHGRPGPTPPPGAGAVGRSGLRLLLLAAALVAAIVVSVGVGAVGISPTEALAILASRFGIDPAVDVRRAAGVRPAGHPHPPRAGDRTAGGSLGRCRRGHAGSATAPRWQIRPSSASAPVRPSERPWRRAP